MTLLLPENLIFNNSFINLNWIGSSNHEHGNGNHFGCDCMEYWTCILGGGTPYSYCGIHAHDVCCFVPVNAEPVGILPTPSRSRCGKKGQDSGRDGEADMAEWPWHVSVTRLLRFIPCGI